MFLDTWLTLPSGARVRRSRRSSSAASTVDLGRVEAGAWAGVTCWWPVACVTQDVYNAPCVAVRGYQMHRILSLHT